MNDYQSNGVLLPPLSTVSAHKQRFRGHLASPPNSSQLASCNPTSNTHYFRNGAPNVALDATLGAQLAHHKLDTDVEQQQQQRRQNFAHSTSNAQMTQMITPSNGFVGDTLPGAATNRCYLCDIPKQEYSLVRSCSEPICRGCLNYEGPDRIEWLISEARRLKESPSGSWPAQQQQHSDLVNAHVRAQPLGFNGPNHLRLPSANYDQSNKLAKDSAPRVGPPSPLGVSDDTEPQIVGLRSPKTSSKQSESYMRDLPSAHAMRGRFKQQQHQVVENCASGMVPCNRPAPICCAEHSPSSAAPIRPLFSVAPRASAPCSPLPMNNASSPLAYLQGASMAAYEHLMRLSLAAAAASHQTPRQQTQAIMSQLQPEVEGQQDYMANFHTRAAALAKNGWRQPGELANLGTGNLLRGQQANKQPPVTRNSVAHLSPQSTDVVHGQQSRGHTLIQAYQQQQQQQHQMQLHHFHNHQNQNHNHNQEQRRAANGNKLTSSGTNSAESSESTPSASAGPSSIASCSSSCSSTAPCTSSSLFGPAAQPARPPPCALAQPTGLGDESELMRTSFSLRRLLSSAAAADAPAIPNGANRSSAKLLPGGSAPGEANVSVEETRTLKRTRLDCAPDGRACDGQQSEQSATNGADQEVASPRTPDTNDGPACRVKDASSLLSGNQASSETSQLVSRRQAKRAGQVRLDCHDRSGGNYSGHKTRDDSPSSNGRTNSAQSSSGSEVASSPATRRMSAERSPGGAQKGDTTEGANGDELHEGKRATPASDMGAQQVPLADLRCLICRDRLEERHFVQCPAMSTHKFCFACSKRSIERQRQSAKGKASTSKSAACTAGNLTVKVFCPSGKKCFLATEPTPWTFMNSEIETIFRDAKV